VGGNQRVYRLLQILYHRGLVNRFCFFGPSGRPGEFNYFLDSPSALELLADLGNIDSNTHDIEAVKRNREKWTPPLDNGATGLGEWEAGQGEVSEGQRYFLRHELMISRFHGAVELACRASAGHVEARPSLKWIYDLTPNAPG
jgi:hypothetical protein